MSGTCAIPHAFLPTDNGWVLVLDNKVEFVRIAISINVKILLIKNASLIFTYFMLA
jgi:hypothetical protein